MSILEKTKKTESRNVAGGKSPANDTGTPKTPRGVELLIKLASVDSDFRQLLLKSWEAAAKMIKLDLDPGECAMLSAISREQLAQSIDRFQMPEKERRAFLEQLATAMLPASESPPKPVEPYVDRENQLMYRTLGMTTRRG